MEQLGNLGTCCKRWSCLQTHPRGELSHMCFGEPEPERGEHCCSYSRTSRHPSSQVLDDCPLRPTFCDELDRRAIPDAVNTGPEWRRHHPYYRESLAHPISDSSR